MIAQDFGHFAFGDRAVVFDRNHGIANFCAAMNDSSDGDPPDIGVIIQHGDQHLKRLIGVGYRRQNPMNDGIQQRLHVHSRIGKIQGRSAFLAGGIDDGEIQLFIGGIEFAKEVKRLIDNLFRSGVGAVDLVNDHDGFEVQFQRFFQHKLGLWHGTVKGID